MSVEQRIGRIEVRWNGDDPDDVVAPWPHPKGEQIMVHVERMDDDHIWIAIYDDEAGKRISMFFESDSPIRWTLGEEDL